MLMRKRVFFCTSLYYEVSDFKARYRFTNFVEKFGKISTDLYESGLRFSEIALVNAEQF